MYLTQPLHKALRECPGREALVFADRRSTYRDLVGEVANIISGNARSVFGHEFMISVPAMIEGAPGAIHLPSQLRSYVIPVYWKSYHAAVVICLQEAH